MLTLAAFAATLSVFIVCFAIAHPRYFNADAEEAPRRSLHAPADGRHILEPLGDKRLLVFISAVCAFFAGVLSVSRLYSFLLYD